jgi:zinc/manganese transport system permease protein
VIRAEASPSLASKRVTGDNRVGFSYNLLSDFAQVWHYQFMQHAFESGTVVAVMAGIVGYFVILRRSAFAAHALSHIGFAGAAGAVLVGVNPVYGLLAFTTTGGIAMNALSPRSTYRDASIGIVLAFMLGLGVLFLNLYTGYATEAYSILFGEILGVSASYVSLTVVGALVVVGVMALIYRPLLFSSLDQDVAEAKGLPLRPLGYAFMLLVAVATTFAVQVVGVLLIFSLLVTPAATAQHLARRPAVAMAISVAIALAVTWVGLFVAFFLPYPVGFFITTSSFALYLLVRFLHHRIAIPEESEEARWKRSGTSRPPSRA